MGYKLRDFVCKKCKHEFEDLVEDLEARCPKCNTKCQAVLSAPNLNTMSMLSPQEYKKKMLKRSAVHTDKLAKEKGLVKNKKN